MQAHRIAIAFVPIAALACAEPVDQLPSTDPVEQLVPYDEPGSNPPVISGGGPSACRTVTVSGTLYYNDLREYGRFADRSTFAPNVPGSKDPWDSSSDRQNFLGLYGALVKVYEVDVVGMSTQGCSSNTLAGTTTVLSDGSWSWSGQVCDGCRIDNEGGSADTGVSIAVRVALDHCITTTRGCFSVDDPGDVDHTFAEHYAGGWGGTTWARWHRNAGLSNPRVFSGAGTSGALGVDYFQANLPSAGVPTDDLQAQAANVFASMIDVTRRVHIVEGVPYDHPTYDKVRAFFPAVLAGSHSHQASKLCIAAERLDDDDPYDPREPTAWIDGAETAHEYGHLVHYQQWERNGKWQSYCYDSDANPQTDDCEESSAQREHYGTAFKEGWASFIARVTFEGANTGYSCASIDEERAPRSTTFTLPGSNEPICDDGPCRDGERFYNDVELALCELWDDDDDDLLHVPFETLVENLADVWTGASQTERDQLDDARYETDYAGSVASPLGLCRFAAVLDLTWPKASIEDALAEVNVDCNL